MKSAKEIFEEKHRYQKAFLNGEVVEAWYTFRACGITFIQYNTPTAERGYATNEEWTDNRIKN